MKVQRRPRGSLDEARKIGLWIEAQADDRLAELAAAAGTTKSALTQWLIEAVEVDEVGQPIGWTKDHPREEELPITTA